MEFRTTLPKHIQNIVDDIDARIKKLYEDIIPKTATECFYFENRYNQIKEELDMLSQYKADLYAKYSEESIILSNDEYQKYLSTGRTM